MPESSADFLFPADVIPHAGLLPKHVFMMATVRRALEEGARRLSILEVGSWVGASALLWAEAILHFGGAELAGRSEILCVDSWAPILSSEDLAYSNYRQFQAAAANDVAYNIFLHNTHLGERRLGVPIRHRRGRSEEVLPELERQGFDIVFVDASHYYDDVFVDVTEARALARIGGVVCGDDYNLDPDQIDMDTAQAALNRDFIQDPRTGQYYHPGVTLAVGEVFGKVGHCGGFWSVDKTAEDRFQPTLLRYRGAFLPAFLDEAGRADFRKTIQTHFDTAFL